MTRLMLNHKSVVVAVQSQQVAHVKNAQQPMHVNLIAQHTVNLDLQNLRKPTKAMRKAVTLNKLWHC
jgi:hypothetical protein